LLRQRLKEDLIAARAITEDDAKVLEVMRIYLQEGADGMESNLHDPRNSKVDFIPLDNAEYSFKDLGFTPTTYLLFTMSQLQHNYDEPKRRYSSDERRPRDQMRYPHHGQIGSPTNPA
jgi:hypothetical protein